LLLYPKAMSSNKILIPINKGYIYVYPDTIVYCRAEGSRTIIKLENGKNCYVTLPLGKLHDRIFLPLFIRCHHSFVLNMKYIREIIGSFKCFILINEEVIPISQRKRPEVRKNILGLASMDEM